MKLQELSDAIDASRYGDQKSIIFRMSGTGFIEMDYALVRKAFDEIVKKISLVESGLDEFTAGEKVLFQFFYFHAAGRQDAIWGEKRPKKAAKK